MESNAMQQEFDYDFTADQWEMLKALRVPPPEGRAFDRIVLNQLIALELVAISGNRPAITVAGRKALIRGSSKLLDLVA